MLIGNKCDMNERREVTYEEGLELGICSSNINKLGIIKFLFMKQALNHRLISILLLLTSAKISSTEWWQHPVAVLKWRKQQGIDWIDNGVPMVGGMPRQEGKKGTTTIVADKIYNVQITLKL